MSGGPEAPPRSRFARLAILAIAVVGTLQLVFLNLVEADRMFVHRREIARLEREVAALEAERAALAEVAGRAHDEVYREQLARKQGFIYPDELRVVTQRP
ncbi:MAG: hypothetical protein GX560_02585 [Deinococcales bacterium]|nr:hypothetical protein [Deinococcales bacterium]